MSDQATFSFNFDTGIRPVHDNEVLLKSSHESATVRAAYNILNATNYLRLNDWQQGRLWPHLRGRLKLMESMGEGARVLELGYIMGFLEGDSINTRTGMVKIAEDAGYVFPS